MNIFNQKIVLILNQNNFNIMLQKQKIDTLPQAIFVERKTDLKFPEGYEPFAEKNARAREKLSKMKFPEGFFAK
jgi:hypothetical protein